MTPLQQRLQEYLQDRKKNNALRQMQTILPGVDFSSNDYLSFAKNEIMRESIVHALQNADQVGSGGSRLLTGNSHFIESVEQKIAQFHEAESALFFNSGYEANVGLVSTLCRRNDLIIYDALCHASLREGIRLSLAKHYAFQHNDVNDLEKKLQSVAGQKFIVIESVYSMDGDLCQLAEVVALAEKYKAEIILDEAHATGVIGSKGEGLAQSVGLHKNIFARVHTFGKAMGSNGGIVLGNNILRNYLINFCKPFIYTTAPNFLQVFAVGAAYDLLQNESQSVNILHERIQHFRRCIEEKKLPFIDSNSAIHCLIVGGNTKVKLYAQQLQDAGFDVRPILSPTVPEGTERLRICLHMHNTKEEISQLVETLSRIITS